MFVLATLKAATLLGPVKIRNMSPAGALIEAGALPAIGEPVSIQRGELAAAGHVVWRLEGRAGVRFDREVDVADWLPAASRRQQQVDQTFQQLKEGTVVPFVAPGAPAGPSPIDRQDLMEAAEALDALADVLAEDAAMIAGHSAKLQALDMASQFLRRFAGAAPVHGVSAAGSHAKP